MRIECADVRDCRAAIKKNTDMQQLFHIDISSQDEPVKLCDNSGAVVMSLAPLAAEQAMTVDGTASMVDGLKEIVKSGGCAIVSVHGTQDFSQLRLMRAMHQETSKNSWVTYVDGDEGMYTRVLLVIGGRGRYYALPFRHSCSFQVTNCVHVEKTWGKLWIALPPCSEYTMDGCPVSDPSYKPVVKTKIDKVLLTGMQQQDDSAGEQTMKKDMEVVEGKENKKDKEEKEEKDDKDDKEDMGGDGRGDDKEEPQKYYLDEDLSSDQDEATVKDMGSGDESDVYSDDDDDGSKSEYQEGDKGDNTGNEPNESKESGYNDDDIGTENTTSGDDDEIISDDDA